MAGIQAGGASAGRLSIEIVAEIARLQQDLDRAKRAVKAASNDIAVSARAANDNTASSARGAARAFGDLGAMTSSAAVEVNKLNRILGLLGIGSLTAALGGAAMQARAFHDAMAEVSTLVDTTVVSMEELNRVALDQSQTFGAAPVDQARALYQIISAGASSAAEATETLTAANKLAIGGVTDVKTAADGLTSILNAYGDSAGTATDVSDSLFVAMRAGKTTIGELSAAIGRVAPLASQLGVSIDELNAATAALTKGGISTAEAMTGLRAVMAAVAKPSSEAAKLAQQLGIDFSAAGLQAKGLAGFMEELATKTGGSQEALAQLFGGVEALVPVLALSGQAGVDMAAILDDMANKAGATEEAFDKMASSPGFQLNQLLAKLKVEAIELGTEVLDKLLPAMRLLNENFDEIVTVIQAVSAGYGAYKVSALALTVASSGVSSAFTLQTAAALSASRQMGVLVTAQTAAGAAATGAATAFRGLTAAMIANPFTAAAVAIGTVTSALILFGQETRNATRDTQGLIAEIKALGQARSHEFSMRMMDHQLRRNEIKEELALLEQRNRHTFQEWKIKEQVQALKWELVEVEGVIRAGNHAMKQAEEAQKAMTASTAAATVVTAEAANAGKARTATLTEEQRALQDRHRETERFIQSINDEIERIGLTAKQLRELEVLKALDVAVTREQIAAINDANRRREEAIAAEERQLAIQERMNQLRQAQDGTRDLEAVIAALEREAEVLGVSGWERARRLLQMEREAVIAPLLNAQLLAQLAGNKALSDEIQKQIDLRNKEFGLRTQMGDWLDEQEQAARRVNIQLSEMVFLLGRIGGVGGALGGILDGIGRGSFSGLGPMGGLADVLMTSRSDRDKQTAAIAEAIGEQFGVNSRFATTMASLLQSASIGTMAGAAVLGQQSTVGQIGSALGGAAGQAVGKSLLGFLGGAAGPVGSILGGIAGGLIGGIFGGSKTANAVVSGSGYRVGGSDSKNHGVADGLGRGVLDGLQKIADQLGATVGNFHVAIGTRGGEYRVNTTGTSLKTGKGAQSFGQDAQAALSAAIADAIRDGALKGLSAGANALLRRGGDLELQLQKALAFEGVFAELERMKDPAGAAMKELEASFAELRKVFNEAGATVAERAQLEELYALKRAEITRQFEKQDETLTRRRELEIQLMQAQGDYMGALALARQQELAELPEALHALQEQVWAAQLVNDRRLLEIQLMEAQGNAAGALAAQREMELAATHESLRGLKQQLWAARDAQEAARAADQLRQAWRTVGTGIMDEVRRIRGLTGADQGGGFAALMAQFNAMTAAARGGDIDAAKMLPGLSQELLRAAELVATSRQELDRVRAQTAASLEATNSAIASLTSSDAALLAAAAAQEASSAGANDNMAALANSNRALQDELAQLRAEVKAGLATVAGNTGRMAKKLDDVTSASGGDAISTVAAA